MAATSSTRLDFSADGLAVLTLDNPSQAANLLGAAVLDEIETHLDSLADKSVEGLVIISAKPGMYIAGADLTEFAAGIDRPQQEVVGFSRRGQQLFARLASGPYVTVAAIDGICVGGGAELAVWCDRRILTTSVKTQIGFPEVKLGLFPGWGGAVRTPRILGLANAVELVTGGENVSAQEAYKLGLADDLVPAGDSTPGSEVSPSDFADLPLPTSALPLLAAAKRLIAAERQSGRYLEDRKLWSSPIDISETELGFLGATASAVIQQKTAGHYPAPMAALELMLGASQADLETACQMESEAFAPLFGSPVNRGLLNVFFLNDRAKKVGRQAEAAAIQTASVLGAGAMGRGIAAANAKRGVKVMLSDVSEDALAAGVAAVIREASYDKQLKGPNLDRALELSAVVDASTDSAELAQSGVVIEAIYEDVAAKQKLLAALEPHAADATVLCSNTSTIPITKLAQGLQRPDRFCGLHFFNPVRKMPLVEVIRGEKTSEATITAMTAYSRKLGKTPIVVNDGPGFLVNRLLMPYMTEAALMVAEGVPIKAIEKAAKQFGMPMGPLTLYDVVGLDVCVHAGGVMRQAFPDRVVPAKLVNQLVDAGRLGQKNSKGFFDYPPPKPGKPPKGVPSSAVEEVIQSAGGAATATHDFDLTDRLMLPMLVEATRALEDGIVQDVRDVDLALILGIGFPPFRGGLFHWADAIGAEAILRKLEPLAKLGKRFEPTDLLATAAQSGEKFYKHSPS